jgi:hypothetical protein
LPGRLGISQGLLLWMLLGMVMLQHHRDPPHEFRGVVNPVD